jgi:hypothetical protein
MTETGTEITVKKRRLASCSILTEDKEYIETIASGTVTHYAIIHEALGLHKEGAVKPIPENFDTIKFKSSADELVEFVKANMVVVDKDYLKQQALDANDIVFNCPEDILKTMSEQFKSGSLQELVSRTPDIQQNWNDLIAFSLRFTMNNTKQAQEWKQTRP